MQLLTDTWRYRYVTSSHLARVRFNRQLKLARRRLRAFTTDGLLRRFAPIEAR